MESWMDIRKRYNINILAVKNEGEFNIAISPDTYLERIVNCWCWENTEPFRSASAYSKKTFDHNTAP